MDEDLVRRAQHGDRHAFSVLAASSVDRLYAVAYRIMRDPDLASEATQQALLEAWRDVRSLRDPGRWEAWTYRLVVHACSASRRSERRYADAVYVLRERPSTIESAERWIADRDELERAFRRLPVEQRAIVILHYYVGLRLTEVADALGIPAGTARSRLHHATVRMRQAVLNDRERRVVLGGGS